MARRLPKFLTIQNSAEFFSLPPHPLPAVQALDISGCGDIHPKSRHTFPNVENLWLSRCDKNFVYYWGNLRVFPSVKRIYLSAHPGYMFFDNEMMRQIE